MDDIVPDPQEIVGLTQAQSNQIFALQKKKAEAEAKAAEAEARIAESKALVAEKEVEKMQLEIDCMRRESDARIAAVIPAGKPSRVVGDDDEDLGEIPLEVRSIAPRFAGLPQDEIIKIFSNKFKAINLSRLRHMHGMQYESYKDQDRIGIEDGALRLRKASGTYKDFGKTVHDVWTESFINYTSIMVSLFGKSSQQLHATMSAFHGKILTLAKVYEWQEAVLPLAIETHTHIIASQPSDASQWKMPDEFQARFCTPLTVLRRRRSRSPPSRRPTPRGDRAERAEKAAGEICDKYNSGTCTWPSCYRQHKCKSCGAAGHGQKTCPTKK